MPRVIKESWEQRVHKGWRLLPELVDGLERIAAERDVKPRAMLEHILRRYIKGYDANERTRGERI